MPGPILVASNLTKHFSSRRGTVVAVDQVSFEISRGETLGIVGESGSGKSTVARLASALVPPTSGTVTLHGHVLHGMKHRELRSLRSRLQVVFQEPFQSLNPTMRIAAILWEPIRIHEDLSRRAENARISEVVADVGLPDDVVERFPHELSGGQQQRIGIARAIVTRPSILILDEPTSSLDLPLQGQILRLLKRLQSEHGMGYLFISHDIGCVQAVSDRIAVMHGGRIVETGTTEDVIARPANPYSRLLLSARLSLPTASAERLPELGHGRRTIL